MSLFVIYKKISQVKFFSEQIPKMTKKTVKLKTKFLTVNTWSYETRTKIEGGVYLRLDEIGMKASTFSSNDILHLVSLTALRKNIMSISDFDPQRKISFVSGVDTVANPTKHFLFIFNFLPLSLNVFYIQQKNH